MQREREREREAAWSLQTSELHLGLCRLLLGSEWSPG